MEEQNKFKGTLTVTDRVCVTLDGVNNVEGFDDTYVLLDTKSGKVAIEGSNMKIESLSADNGVILIRGNINSVYYSDKKAGKGFLSRLFG